MHASGGTEARRAGAETTTNRPATPTKYERKPLRILLSAFFVQDAKGLSYKKTASRLTKREAVCYNAGVEPLCSTEDVSPSCISMISQCIGFVKGKMQRRRTKYRKKGKSKQRCKRRNGFSSCDFWTKSSFCRRSKFFCAMVD